LIECQRAPRRAPEARWRRGLTPCTEADSHLGRRGSRAALKAGSVPENHWRRSLSSERLRSADTASLAHSAASCNHASRSTGLMALSAFRQHSSASRRYLLAAVSDIGSSKRGSVLSARQMVRRLVATSHAYGVESALDTGSSSDRHLRNPGAHRFLCSSEKGAFRFKPY
jgi:hypothetical protein